MRMKLCSTYEWCMCTKQVDSVSTACLHETEGEKGETKGETKGEKNQPSYLMSKAMD